MIGIYFSGTGNTKHCSEYLLRLLDENAPSYSIENENAIDAIRSSDEIIFAYPVYYSYLPKIVYDFIVNNSAAWKDKNIFVVATMGLFSGDGAGCAARLFKKYGAKILGGLHIKMPDCIGDVIVFYFTFNNVLSFRSAASEFEFILGFDFIVFVFCFKFDSGLF